MSSSPLSKIKSFDPSAVIKKPLVYDEKKVRSGPGALGEFMQRESQVFIENTQLKHDLDEAKKLDVVTLIDPNKIRPSQFANRLEINFESEDFEGLKKSILQHGGNAQPIKVRPSQIDGQFEIVFGHRRHRACLELGIPVSAVIAKGMSEKQLFCEMERENQFRKNISAYEQGIAYKKVLEIGLYDNFTSLAKDIEISKSSVSRALTLVNFPKEIIKAFSNPTVIQFRWIDGLNKVITSNGKNVIAEAVNIKNEIVKLPDASVYAKLISAGGRGKYKTENDGIKLTKKLVDNSRGVRFLLNNLPKDESKRNALIEKIDNFLANLKDESGKKLIN